METYISPRRLSDLERRSLLTGYLLRVVMQPDIAMFDAETADQLGITWHDVNRSVHEANRKPSLYSANERKDMAAYQTLRAIAFSYMHHLPAVNAEGQNILLPHYRSRNMAPGSYDRHRFAPAERLKNQSREVYTPMARMLRSCGINFEPDSYDRSIASHATIACEQDPATSSEIPNTSSLRLIHRIWNRRGLVSGNQLDLQTGDITHTDVHFYENFQPSPQGKYARQTSLVADLNRLNPAFS